ASRRASSSYAETARCRTSRGPTTSTCVRKGSYRSDFIPTPSLVGLKAGLQLDARAVDERLEEATLFDRDTFDDGSAFFVATRVNLHSDDFAGIERCDRRHRGVSH